MLTNGMRISCATETKNQIAEVPEFSGLLTIPNNSSSNPGQSGGVLLALDVNIKPSVYNLKIEILHSTRAISNVSRKIILVGGLYCFLNSNEKMKRALNEVRFAMMKRNTLGKSNLLFCGYFNARHSSRGDKSNAQGKILNNSLQIEDRIALKDGEPTFTCTNGEGVIDLTICNANLHRQFCGLAMDYYSEMFTGAQNRGHYPVIATFDIA